MATTALDATYAELEPAAQRVYRTLGTLPAPVTDPDLVAAVCDLSLPTCGWLLEILAEERLLDPAPEGRLAARYRMNTVLRGHAQSKAAAEPDAAGQHEAALRRLCDWTLEQLRHAQRLLVPAPSGRLAPRALPDTDAKGPFPDGELALAWLDDQAENLLPVLDACRDTGWDELTYQLVDAWWPFFQRPHLYELWLPAHGLGVAAARRAGNEPAVRQLLASWAIGLSHSGRPADAIPVYEDLLHAARAAGDVRDQGQALLGHARTRAGDDPEDIADAHQQRGEEPVALDCSRSAATAFASIRPADAARLRTRAARQ